MNALGGEQVSKGWVISVKSRLISGNGDLMDLGPFSLKDTSEFYVYFIVV